MEENQRETFTKRETGGRGDIDRENRDRDRQWRRIRERHSQRERRGGGEI